MRRYLVVFSMVFLAPCIALAAEPNCHSITDLQCGETPLLQEHGARVTVKTAEKGTKKYKQKHHDEDDPNACATSVCSCEANVEYLQLSGNGAGIDAINREEKKAADAMRCSRENAMVTRQPYFVSTSPTLISTAIFELEYCQGCGGSCHGQTSLATYDAATGKRYRLGDMLTIGTLPKLQKDLRAAFIKQNAEQDDRDSVEESIGADDTLASADSDIYIDNGQPYISVNTFIHCASGSFHPLPIPKKYITPEFAKLLASH